ncbi:hypothetical protein, partial [Pseudomonas quercus]
MNIGLLTSTASKVLAAGTQAAGKISISGSTRRINAGSMDWLNKASSSVGKHIRASIENGKIFELASLGANMFGAPAISERNSTYHPVLNFEPDHNNDLNLSKIYMQDNAGKLNPWDPSPAAVATSSSPSQSNAQSNAAASSLPQRPPVGLMLSSVGVALSHFQQTQRDSSPTDRSSKKRPNREEYEARINAGTSVPTSKAKVETGNSGPSRRPSREEYEARINAGTSVPTSKAKVEAGNSGPSRRPSREEYEARINAGTSVPTSKAKVEAGNSGPSRRPSREEYEARINASTSVPTSKAKVEAGNSGPSRRPSREEYEARINAKQTETIGAEAYSGYSNNNPNLNTPKDPAQRFAESIQSMQEHQNEMQQAEALLKSEPDSYTKPRLSRKEFED